MTRYTIDDETLRLLMTDEIAPNDPALNKAIAERLKSLHERAAQQPVSYIQLFRDAIDLAEDQFKRAMRAEKKLADLDG